MTETKERRYIERKTLPRTVVYFRRNSRFSLMNAFRGPVRLVDISKSAICVEGDLPFPNKTDLQLKICPPDNSVIFLKGRVSVTNSDMQRRIIQILPFGKGMPTMSSIQKPIWKFFWPEIRMSIHLFTPPIIIIFQRFSELLFVY